MLRDLPSLLQLTVGLPLGFATSGAYLYLAGRLKRDRGWRTGYSRKLFHFLVFSTAAVVQVGLGFAALLVFGGATSLLIFYAVLRGDGNLLYEAMARESDAPRRTLFILIPYLATLLGGVLSNALFGGAAVCGYLVAGLGDAAGEPVGTRFGRHRYRAPSQGGVPAARSLEGSAAVFAVSLAAVVLAQSALGVSPRMGPAVVIALASTAVEAVSPHGWDNLTMQVVPSALAAYFLAA